jgi:hypothetical protein
MLRCALDGVSVLKSDAQSVYVYICISYTCTPNLVPQYRSFLDSQGGLAVLYMHTYIINRKQCPLEVALLSTTDADSSSSDDSINVLMPQAAASFLSEVTARENGEVHHI